MHDEHDVIIDDLVAEGAGVGRLADGRVIFVEDALPGDRVRVRLAHNRKGVQYAELIALRAPSLDRVESRCEVAACGGCAFKSMRLFAQALAKRRRVVETLRRVGGIDVAALLGEVQGAGDGWRTRHRVRLHAQWSGGRWHLGYHARRRQSFVELATCPVLWGELERAAQSFAKTLAGLPRAAGLETVEIAYSRRDARAAVRLTGAGEVRTFVRWLAQASAAGSLGIAVAAAGRGFAHGDLELRYDHQRAAEFDLCFEPGVFTQAHPAVNDRLVETVLRSAGAGEGRRVLELHAGIGNFSVPLRFAGDEVVAIERHRPAAALCWRNGRAAGVDLEVRAQADEEAVRDLRGFDVVLLDPPRTGARAAALAIAGSPNIERVVYVSCDVATLARDARELARGGFRVAMVKAFDMFPQTPHVEVVMALTRSPEPADGSGCAP